jgi:hypothetical protein
MCGLFPELPRNIVRHLLRDGLTVNREDVQSREVLDCLCDLDIVTIREHVYVQCACRDDYDFLDRDDLKCKGRVEVVPIVEDYYCPECGQPIGDISRKTRFVECEVKLDSEGVERYLLSALGSLKSVQDAELVGPAAYSVVTAGGMQLKVVIPDITPAFRTQDQLRQRTQVQSAGFVFSEPTLYVIASPINECPRTALEEGQYIGLTNLLSEPKEALEEIISLAATSIQGRYDLREIESRFEEMIARHSSRDWQFFEQEFVPALLHHISTSPELVEKYLRLLRRLSSAIFGYYHVPVGGAGQPDFVSIDKFELMRQVFQGGIEGDAKCYIRSTLSDGDMAKIAYHLDRSKTEATMAVVFMAGHDVASTAWTGMMEMKRKGRWRVVIVPKYLILELIAALEADHLLDI